MTTTEKGAKTGAEKLAQGQTDEVQAVKDTDPTDAGANELALAGVGKDAEVLKADAELSSSVYDTADAAEFVTLSKDIVEEFYYPDTMRPSYRILYTKGQVVPKAAIDAHNAAVAHRKKLAENGGVDPENPAGIDSTTIASGTRVPGADGGAAKK